MTGGRGTLSRRIVLLAVGVAVLTALLAGLLAVSLTRTSADDSARSTLAAIADAAAERADAGAAARVSQNRAVRTLGTLGIESASVGRAGAVASTSPLARDALTPARRAALLAGDPISDSDVVSGTPVLIEGRPTEAGGIVLVQRRSDATADSDRLVRRVLLALLIAAVVAVVVSIIVARRVARPLHRTAEAAHALAAGRRDVRVPVEGPAEVAEVASALNSLAGSLSPIGGAPARLPPVGVARPPHAPDRHQRLRRVTREWCRAGRGDGPGGRCRPHRGQAARAARRRPPRPRPARRGPAQRGPGGHRPRRPRTGGRVRLVEAVLRRRGALRLRPDRGPGLDRHRPGAGAPARRRPPRERPSRHAVRSTGARRGAARSRASTSSRCATAGRA